MFWSIINEADILYDEKSVTASNALRSSNPYDYLCKGYFIENASMFGGKDFVDYNSNISGNRTGTVVHTADI